MPIQPPRGVLDPGLRGLTIGLILTVTLVAFEALAVATALPAAEDDLGDIYLYGWTFSAFLLASLIGIAFAGERSDISGPALPFVLGLVLFAVGLLVGGLAQSMLILVGARAIQGLGAGAIPAVAYVSIGRAYPDSLRPRMLALFATAWVVPGLVGPGVAGVVAEYLSWRIVFLGIIPFVAGAALLALPGLRSVGPPAIPGHRRSLIPMSILLAFGAGLALTGPTLGSAPVAVPFIIVGLLIAVVPLKRLLPAGTLVARRGLPAAVAGTAILNFAFFGADAFIPLMLTEVRGQTTVVAGIVITITTLTWTGGSWVMERLGHRVGRGRLIRLGLGLIIVGTIMIIPVTGSAPLWLAGVAWAIAGAGIGLSYPGFSLAALSSTTEGSEGAAATSVKTAEFLAAAGGAGIGGAIVGAGDAGGWLPESLAINFALMALVCVPGLYAAVRLVFPSSLGEVHPSPVQVSNPSPAGTIGQ
ncbi:MAG: MFS transporter [Dehalococcoidia bacterium]|nr:MFS transporter [Dehalococcoidia bacterium]MCB9485197.1 MFS transporter [Thermoflexaceae bacterium]